MEGMDVSLSAINRIVDRETYEKCIVDRGLLRGRLVKGEELSDAEQLRLSNLTALINRGHVKEELEEFKGRVVSHVSEMTEQLDRIINTIESHKEKILEETERAISLDDIISLKVSLLSHLSAIVSVSDDMGQFISDPVETIQYYATKRPKHFPTQYGENEVACFGQIYCPWCLIPVEVEAKDQEVRYLTCDNCDHQYCVEWGWGVKTHKIIRPRFIKSGG